MALKLPIYMDNHATTPVDPRVVEAMLPYFTRALRQRGQPLARLRLERPRRRSTQAREQVGGAHRRQRQGDRLDLGRDRVGQPGHQGRGRVLQGPGQPHHHRADRAQGGARHLQAPREGGLRGHLPAGRARTAGSTRRRWRAAMTDKTILVSIMLANNEIGTVNPVDEIGEVVKERGVLFHIDAVQGVGKIPFDVERAPAPTWCRCRRTRCTGPRASGALYVRRKPRVRLHRADRRRRARARHALGHAERAGHRRLRQGGGDRAGRDGGGERAPAGAARAAAPGHAGAGQRHLRQRLAGAPAARQPQHLLRLRRGRGDDDGAQGRGGVVGVGLHLGLARAVLRAARAGRRRGAGAHLDPLRPRALQHRGRGRLRGRRWWSTRSTSCARCRRSTRWPRRASTSRASQWAAH